MSRQLGLLLLVALAGCAAPVAHDDEPVANASSTLSVAAGSGLAFVRLDGFMATGDVSTSYVNLWAGHSGLPGYPVVAVQGPRLGGTLSGWGSLLTREWNGTSWGMRGRLIAPNGVPTEIVQEPLPTVQDATHVVAIPDGGFTGNREVFFYSSSTGTGSISTYGYNDSTRRFVVNTIPSLSWTGFGQWHQIVGYPKGVLFFQKTGEVVWRGRWSPTAGWPFTFAPLPSPPHTRAFKPSYTDVAYVEGGCDGHFFYDRNSGQSIRVRYDVATDTIAWAGSRNVENVEENVNAGWDKVIGTGNGKVLLLRADGSGRVLDLCTGESKDQSGFTPDWTSITRVE